MKEKTERKKMSEKIKKSQIPIALLIIGLTVLFTIYLSDIKLSLYLLFGIGFGIVLQRSRFCFTAAFRDPIMTKTTSITNALLLSIAIGSIGVVILNFIWNLHGKRLMGIDAIYPLSPLTIIGGILFGIGMVIASGCASGTLVRMGEGFKLQWISFFFFLIGAISGSGLMGYLDPVFAKSKITVFLPDNIGWIGSLVLQLILLSMTYLLIKKFAKRKRRQK